MVINKIDIYFNDKNFEWKLNKKDVVVASENQLGKSTIIKSILYAYGADAKIVFNKMRKKPTFVVLETDMGTIKRGVIEDVWTLDGRKTSIEKIKSTISDFGKVRVINGVDIPKLLDVARILWYKQRKDNDLQRKSLPKIHPETKTDIFARLAGSNNADLIEYVGEYKNKLKQNKKIKKQALLSAFVEDITGLSPAEIKKIDDVIKTSENIEQKIRKYKMKIWKYKKVIDTYEGNSKLIDEMEKLFIDKTIIDSNHMAHPVWPVIRKTLNFSEKNSISLSDYLGAIEKKKVLIESISEEKEKKKSMEEKINTPVTRIKYIRKSILEVSARNMNKNYHDLTSLSEKEQEYRRKNSEMETSIESIVAKDIDKYEKEDAEDGIGELLNWLLTVRQFSSNFNMPILLDSFEEVATSRPMREIIIPILESMNIQIIATMTIEKDKQGISAKDREGQVKEELLMISKVFNIKQINNKILE